MATDTHSRWTTNLIGIVITAGVLAWVARRELADRETRHLLGGIDKRVQRIEVLVADLIVQRLSDHEARLRVLERDRK